MRPLALAVLVAALLPTAASARPAPPDRPFGGRDGVVYPVPGVESAGSAVTVLASGRIVAAGSTRRRGGDSFAVVRLSRRGRVERRRYVSFPEAPYAGAVDMAQARGGSLVLAGLARDDLGVGRVALAAVRPTLAPDPGFGAAGRALGPPVDHTLEVKAMALDRAGRIVVLSTIGYPTRIVVTRFLADGSLDRGFGSDGSWTSPRGAAARAVATVRGGGVLVAGRPSRRGVRQPAFLFARLSPRGVLRSLDIRRVGYGVRGTGPSEIVARRDGSAWVAGSMSDRYRRRRRPVILRYGPRGRLDPSFGRGGVRRLGRPRGTFTTAGLVRRRDGRLLLGGVGGDGDRWTFYGLTRGGRPDPRIGELWSKRLAAFGMALLGDFATRGRRIVAVGTDEQDERIDYYSYLMVAALRITER